MKSMRNTTVLMSVMSILCGINKITEPVENLKSNTFHVVHAKNKSSVLDHMDVQSTPQST